MPDMPAPTLTLAIQVPDYRALACAFAAEDVAPLTFGEARNLAGLRIEVPADASKSAIEIAVHSSVEAALPTRCILAKLLAGGVGEVYVMDYGKGRSVLLGEFAPVETVAQTEVAA